jgi:CYTH domain-containing protein
VTSRTPGEGRYSHLEREQRWLLRTIPKGRSDPVEIVDRYLTGTTLRLRLMRSHDGIIRKFGQKVRLNPGAPEFVNITTMYLGENEYAALASMTASELIKTRWRWTPEHRTLALDVFHGQLEGLVLAETELGAEEERLALLPTAVADVTDNDRYTGGALAALDARGADDLLTRGVR